MATTNKYSPKEIMNRNNEGNETPKTTAPRTPGSRVEGGATGRLNREGNKPERIGGSSSYGDRNRNRNGEQGATNPKEMEARKREANFRKMKDIVANKDIYELTDDEKKLFVEFHPELFYHGDDDIGDAEFITTDPIAEVVLSDYFIKKERTKGMDFLFNFHSQPAGDDVLND